MTDRQKMNELAAMFSSLSRRERYALDAYLANRDDKGARRLAFEMAIDDTPVWTASQWASKTRLFWSRRDVESYMEYKALEARARAAAVSEGYEDDELKTAMMMRREIQRKMAEAEAQNDFDAGDAQLHEARQLRQRGRRQPGHGVRAAGVRGRLPAVPGEDDRDSETED